MTAKNKAISIGPKAQANGLKNNESARKLTTPTANLSATALDSLKAHKLSITVPADVGRRLRRLAFEQRLSESSVVEVALRNLFARGDDSLLGVLLRDNGAALRRRVE
ncbi:MAG: hypothetical protein GIW99_04750 [Candidatus Eremiobacteraeota bacterium]|nr:hypothetical protein [Candidatus Eremiobacteraeota bacterium]